MNKVIEMGRLTKKVELRYTQGAEPMAVALFSLAVDAKKDVTYFINMKAFGKTAEALEKYTDKGTKILVEGHIQTGSYEKDGKKVYTTDIVADSFEFCEKKGDSPKAEEPKENDGFMNVPEGMDEELPFM